MPIWIVALLLVGLKIFKSARKELYPTPKEREAQFKRAANIRDLARCYECGYDFYSHGVTIHQDEVAGGYCPECGAVLPGQERT
jgi:predicted RNA-binding Zn-ribbon protein involved in translation (DUF1610 family)